MNIGIRQLGMERFDLIFNTVLLLLEELRESPSDNPFRFKDKILADWKRNPEHHIVFAAFDEDRVVGIITLSENFAIYTDGNHGTINELYVAPEYRSRGVGKMLLDKAVSLAKERDWQRIEVTAPFGEKWAGTIAFYLREGFTEAGPKLRLFP